MPSSTATPRTSTPSMLNPNANPPQTKICVYCGSSAGKGTLHIEAAQALGKAMAENDIGLGNPPCKRPAPTLIAG